MADLFLAVQISSYQLVLKEDLMKEVAPGIHKIVEEVKQNELKEYFISILSNPELMWRFYS